MERGGMNYLLRSFMKTNAKQIVEPNLQSRSHDGTSKFLFNTPAKRNQAIDNQNAVNKID